jgi:hypothetical protein
MARGGGGAPEGDGGGPSGDGGGRFFRTVLFGPGFNMGSVDLASSDEEQESMSLSPGPQPPEDEAMVGESSSQVPASHLSEEPLSHYIPDDGG